MAYLLQVLPSAAGWPLLQHMSVVGAPSTQQGPAKQVGGPCRQQHDRHTGGCLLQDLALQLQGFWIDTCTSQECRCKGIRNARVVLTSASGAKRKPCPVYLSGPTVGAASACWILASVVALALSRLGRVGNSRGRLGRVT